MSSAEIKRRQVFVLPRFQGRFIAVIVGLVAIGSLCSAALLYPLLASELSVDAAGAHHRAADTLRRLLPVIAVGGIASILVSGISVGIAVLYISHKIAGPLYRLERICGEIGHGNFDVSTRLRSGDQLTSLADGVGAMARELRDRRAAQIELIENARKLAGTVSAMSTLDGAVPAGAQLAALLDQLERSLRGGGTRPANAASLSTTTSGA
ncbi:MAG: hypothetical protein HYV63_16420 [Candidatus Schekmanbacteria bacterium]|nr:hypothetical protein [Candidatus Schekmanbacteria bacterium]